MYVNKTTHLKKSTRHRIEKKNRGVYNIAKCKGWDKPIQKTSLLKCTDDGYACKQKAHELKSRKKTTEQQEWVIILKISKRNKQNTHWTKVKHQTQKHNWNCTGSSTTATNVLINKYQSIRK